MTDPADALGVVPTATPDAARREATFRATAGVLNRRRWARRAAGVLGAAGLFAGGGAVGWFAKPTPPAVVSSQEARVEPPAPRTEVTEPLTAERLEIQAEMSDDPAEASRLYREAGDKFLTDRDYENAARCYRRHLSVADDDARKASASDSWMLHTMKVPAR